MPHTIPQIKIIAKKEMQLVYKDIIATPHPVSDGNKESLRIYTGRHQFLDIKEEVKAASAGGVVPGALRLCSGDELHSSGDSRPGILEMING